MTKPTKTPKTPAFKLVEGAGAITQAITSIATRGKKLEKDIHVIAVSCLNHADKHGDITLANRLIAAVPTMARKNALRDWFLAFGKFSYDAKSKSLVFNKTGVTLLQDAMVTPFWDFKPEPEYVPFDINASIANLIKKANAAIEKGENVDKAKLDAIKALVE